MDSKIGIISTEDLDADMKSGQHIKILDCSVSMGRQPGDCPAVNFWKEHIQGAQYLDLNNLKDNSTDLPFMMPDQNQFINSMKRLNVKLSDRVVCYDTGSMQFFGYRAAWMLQAMGHQNVQVLDGGFPKWKAEGRACHGDARVNGEDFAYKLVEGKLKTLENIKAFAENEASRDF